MDKELEARLKEMLDKQEIHEAMLRYCRGVDRGDADLVGQTYHEGAVDDHGDFIVAGKDIVPVLMALGARPKNGGMHFIGNNLIEVQGDVAFSESYFLAIKDFDNEGQSYLRIRAGRYIDRFERRNGRWAVVERALADEWNVTNKIMERIGSRGDYRKGTHDKNDLVYQVKKGRVARTQLSDIEEVKKRPVVAKRSA